MSGRIAARRKCKWGRWGGGAETKQAARGGSVMEAGNESEEEDLSVVARGMRTVQQMAVCAREAVWQAKPCDSAYPIVRARTGAAACLR